MVGVGGASLSTLEHAEMATEVSIASAAKSAVFIGLEICDEVADAFFRFAGARLDATDDFVFFAFLEKKIVVRELCPFLFRFAFDFVPAAFEFELCHSVVLLDCCPLHEACHRAVMRPKPCKIEPLAANRYFPTSL